MNVCLLTGSETACARANKTSEQYATGVAVTVVTIGGIALVGAAPEVIAAARVALEGCKANPAYCLNQAGILTAEAVVPGGTGAGGSLVIGRTAQEIAAAKNAAQSLPSVDKLSQAASSANRNGLSDAGRSLQKHSGRPDSVYSATDKKATTLNSEAQFIVDDILTNPGTKFEAKKVFENRVEINVIEAKAPDGRILRFNEDGTRFIGFREPPTPKK